MIKDKFNQLMNMNNDNGSGRRRSSSSSRSSNSSASNSRHSSGFEIKSSKNDPTPIQHDNLDSQDQQSNSSSSSLDEHLENGNDGTQSQRFDMECDQYDKQTPQQNNDQQQALQIISKQGQSNQQQQQHALQQQLQQASTEEQARPKRNPYCSRCRNHGRSAQVKGHKRHCEYRDCQCEGCRLVECRQIVSAAQIRRRRYQKQDEECGRHIEISPPVLKREPSKDPAALIAKTLVGSATVAKLAANEICMSPASHKQLSSAAVVAPVSVGHQNHHQLSSQMIGLPHSLHSAASIAAAAAAAAANSVSTSSTTLSSLPAAQGTGSQISHQLHSGHHHHHQHHLHNHLLHQNQLTNSSNCHSFSMPNAAHFNLAHLTSQHELTAATQTNSNLSSDAYRLFNFPSSVLSAAAAASLSSYAAQNPLVSNHAPSNLAAAAAVAAQNVANTSSSCQGGALTTASQAPAIRDQFNLVKEIYQIFGPVAIYAWLRAEQFDLQKIRNLIELAKVPFDEMLHVNGHPPVFGFRHISSSNGIGGTSNSIDGSGNNNSGSVVGSRGEGDGGNCDSNGEGDGGCSQSNSSS